VYNQNTALPKKIIVKSTNVRNRKLIVAKMEKKTGKNPRLKNKTRYLSEICLANFEFLILLMRISKKKSYAKTKKKET